MTEPEGDIPEPVLFPCSHSRAHFTPESGNSGARLVHEVGQRAQRGTAEQWIKEGKTAIKWTRLSCRRFRHVAVRLQLHALAYNLATFMRTLALPKQVEHWSLTMSREKLVKIGAKLVAHDRYVTLKMAEVAAPRDLFREKLNLIDELRRPSLAAG